MPGAAKHNYGRTAAGECMSATRGAQFLRLTILRMRNTVYDSHWYTCNSSASSIHSCFIHLNWAFYGLKWI